MHASQSMHHSRFPANADSAVQLRTALWIWFYCGLAALLLCPTLRGSSSLFGWLPFWLVVAPLIDLAVLRWSWLAATSRALLVRSRRRRRLAPSQAWRSQHARKSRRTRAVDIGRAPV